MSRALEQANVGIVADNHIQIAERGNFLAKADMAGVKPVVAAGDDNFFPAGQRWHRQQFGETFQFVGLENAISDLVPGGEFLPRQISCRFEIRPE